MVYFRYFTFLPIFLLSSVVFASADDVLSMDNPNRWVPNNSLQAIKDLRTTDQGVSLRVSFDNYVILSSENFELNSSPKIFKYDVYVPDQESAWVGQIKSYFSCPSKGVYNIEISHADLGVYPKGAFNTISEKIPSSIASTVDGYCSDASVSFGLNKSNEIAYILLDSVMLSYDIKVDTTPLCSLSRVEPGSFNEGTDGFFEHQRWMMTEFFNIEMSKMVTLLEQHRDLSIIDYTYDDNLKTIRILVDRENFNDVSLGKIESMLEENGVNIPVTLQPTCYSKSIYDEIISLANDSSVFTRAPLDLRFDKTSGQIVISVMAPEFNHAHSEFSHFGGAVRVEEVEYEFNSRENDGEPHYGGALITFPLGNKCTSGFIATKVIGGRLERGAVTNWHCLSNHSSYQGINVFSGSQFYGQTYAQESVEYDAVFIRPDGESFDSNGTFHTSLPVGDTRKVVGSALPFEGQSVCISGGVTKAICGLRVQKPGSFDYPFTRRNATGTGYLRNVFSAVREDGVQVRASGDSGAPIYQKLSGSDAYMIGIHFGGPVGKSNQSDFQRVVDIEQALGVSIETR